MKDPKENFIDKMMDVAEKYNDTAYIFNRNYKDMKSANTKKADKYFHAKANCEAGQNGGWRGATIMSLGRELVDGAITNPFVKKLTPKQNAKDVMEDLYVDFYGLGKGMVNPDGNCRELINKFRPNGLNENY